MLIQYATRYLNTNEITDAIIDFKKPFVNYPPNTRAVVNLKNGKQIILEGTEAKALQTALEDAL